MDDYIRMPRELFGSNKPKEALMLFCFALCNCLIMGIAGCAWTDKNGTHHLIVGVGFGIVTSKNDVGVDVMDSRILGVEIGSFGAGFGWMQHHRVSIDPSVASNAVVSINRNPFGLTVKNFNPYSSAFKQN